MTRKPGSISTVPSVGSSWLRINFNRVVLPAPFLPINPTRSPWLMRKKTWRRMGLSSKDLYRLLRRMKLIKFGQSASMDKADHAFAFTYAVNIYSLVAGLMQPGCDILLRQVHTQ